MFYQELAEVRVRRFAPGGRRFRRCRPPRQASRTRPWLAGRWVGEGLGGRGEDTWAPAAGGQMLGHFQLVKAGKPVFFELMLIDSQPAGRRLRVKHFNPDFTALGGQSGLAQLRARGASSRTELRFKGLTLGREGR